MFPKRAILERKVGEDRLKVKISKDIFVNRTNFTKCMWCNTPFTDKFLPNLLTCGHFICNDCPKDPIWNSKPPKCIGKT